MAQPRRVMDVVYNKNSLEIDAYVKDNSIDLTFTSPPYFNLKDYRCEGQIGHGQEYKEYLESLQQVFEKVYRKTKENGLLWIVIDTIKMNSDVLPIPFDLAEKLKPIGWKLKDILIWKKNKTVPYSNNSFRKLFEYVLIFAKGDYALHLDRERCIDKFQLKQWWMKYPERYSPLGKCLDEIWEHDIPNQGAWGDKSVCHECPFPPDLVDKVIQLSTNKGDVVLDPFAGTGIVLKRAKALGRKYVGFELNKDYYKRILDSMKDDSLTIDYEKDYQENQADFKKMIWELRALKYCRVLIKKINQKESVVKKAFVSLIKYDEIGEIKCEIILLDKRDLSQIEIDTLIAKPPLSKFEITSNFFILKDEAQSTISKNQCYGYTLNNTHQHCKGDEGIIFSPICLNYEEDDYNQNL